MQLSWWPTTTWRPSGVNWTALQPRPQSPRKFGPGSGGPGERLFIIFILSMLELGTDWGGRCFCYLPSSGQPRDHALGGPKAPELPKFWLQRLYSWPRCRSTSSVSRIFISTCNPSQTKRLPVACNFQLGKIEWGKWQSKPKSKNQPTKETSWKWNYL